MKIQWKKNWKRPAVVLAVLVLVGASVYLNWRYAGNVAQTDKILGQATLVNENGNGVSVTEDTAAENDYFATARLSRKQARDSAISMLQEAEVDENATEEVCNEASQTLQVLAGYTVAESQIENLVTAKGYADCVVFMGTDSCSVVVDAGEDGLDAELRVQQAGQGYCGQRDPVYCGTNQDHGGGLKAGMMSKAGCDRPALCTADVSVGFYIYFPSKTSFSAANCCCNFRRVMVY